MPVQRAAKASVGNVDRAVTVDRETPSHQINLSSECRRRRKVRMARFGRGAYDVGQGQENGYGGREARGSVG